MLSCSSGGNEKTIEQASVVNDQIEKGNAVATFAGGCFWCLQEIFEEVKGVNDVVSGYAGGKEKNPSYEEVSSGKTGHAESVQIYYDPKAISYQELLKVFFGTHDPTTPDQQGPDKGKQYRSVVFYHNEKQKEETEAYINQLNQSGKFDHKIVTEVVPYKEFYKAEAYHQNYYRHHPDDSYIKNETTPRVMKFRKEFKDMLKNS